MAALRHTSLFVQLLCSSRENVGLVDLRFRGKWKQRGKVGESSGMAGGWEGELKIPNWRSQWEEVDFDWRGK